MEKIFTYISKIRRVCVPALRRAWQWYKSLYSGRWYKKVAVGFVSFLLLLLVYLLMVFNNFLWLFGKSPSISEIRHPQTAEASVLYSADGKMIGKFFNENRTPVAYEEINPDFWKVLIDTEDERFYKHAGIDVVGLFSAAKDAMLHHDARGASTITQQLAKNMFQVRSRYGTGLLGYIPGAKLLIVKSKEWMIACLLEMFYTKKEILAMYANTVDFSSQAYGIKTACKTYFNTTPQRLRVEQAAVLVGMLKATTLYSPTLNPENSRQRRNVVMMNMVRRGDLSQAAYDSLSVKPIELDYDVETNYDGEAQYFRNAVADHLKDWCQENGYDLYTSGLKIYTTLDSRMQAYAEQAAAKQMQHVQQTFNAHWGSQEPWQDEQHRTIPEFVEKIARRLPVYKSLERRFPDQPDSVDFYLNKPHTVKLFDYEHGTIERELSTMDSIRYMLRFMHCSMVAVEPGTGHVKAWVGDIDFNHWKYDKVTAMRQPGSTFKLFVYTEAMNQGLTPCDERRDEFFSMEVYDPRKKEYTRWTPTNANGFFTGDSIPLKCAFARSINSIAVRLGQEVGIPSIVNTAQQMGIHSPLDPTPSLTLGASDVTLLELTDAYATAAAGGEQIDPVLVTRIEDRNGNVVYQASQETKRVLSAKTAFLVQQLLMAGLREPGATSMNLWGYIGDVNDTDFGGKTGTSNNHSDAWFMAVSPRLVVGAWVGGEYRAIHFRTGQLGQGSRTALPICGLFLQSVMHDPQFQRYHAKFVEPTNAGVSRGMYTCPSYIMPEPDDSLGTDSLQTDESEEEI